MRKACEIRLVLLGTGLALGLAACGESEACRQARAENRPDTNSVCHSSSSVWHASYWGGGGGRSSASTRGGFGASAAGYGGGG
jgi:hypothetical protein